MADKDQDNSIFTSPISPSARRKLQDRFDNSTKKIQRKQLEMDNDDLDLADKTKKLTQKIDLNITKILGQFASAGNPTNNVEVTDTMITLAQKSGAAQRRMNGKKFKKELDAIKNEVLTSNKQQLSSMIDLNRRKVGDAIATYNMIIKIIPKMRLALTTIANTIISPDDFTKDSLSIHINAEGVAEEDQKVIRERIEKLLVDHNINKKLKEDVTAFLKNGKLFFLALSMNDQIKKMLSEHAGEQPLRTYQKLTTILSDKDKRLMEGSEWSTEASQRTESDYSKWLSEGVQEAFGIDRSKVPDALKNVDTFLQEHFIIGNSSHLAAEHSQISSLSEDVNMNFFGVDPTSVMQNNVAQQNKGAPQDGKVTPEDIPVGGRERPIFKRVNPANIVPLEFDGNVLGYIHLDIVEIDPDGTVLPSDKSQDSEDNVTFMPAATQSGGNGSILQNMVMARNDISMDGNNRMGNQAKAENPNGSPQLDAVDDARLMFIANVFANKMSRDSNIKLLRKNETLKYAIYSGLAIKKLTGNEKIRIVYLKPEEVIHINRGQSIFDNILFFAKLYIATLVTILMQNVLRGADKRAVYVDIGLNNDASASVQQVVRDLKSKEITGVHNLDMQTILNVVGEFNDYYIPTIK
jgi:hypothetical protein